MRTTLILLFLLGCDADSSADLGDLSVDAAVDARVDPRDGSIPSDASPIPPDAGADGARPPDPDAAAPPVDVSCTFEAREGEQTVDTWRGNVDRIAFEIPVVPDPSGVRQARLRFSGHDLDHPGEEGWVSVNGGPRAPLPGDGANDNQTIQVELAVDGQLVEGTNRVDFFAFDRPDGSFFRVSQVRLVLTGAIECGEPVDPPDPSGLVPNATPLGVSAFAALATDFPQAGLFQILGGLQRPFTSILLDFGPVHIRHGLQMYGPGAVGQRAPNEAQLDRLTAFLQAYVVATPNAASRHLQIYLFNGPGIRRAGYPRAFDLDPAAFDRAVRQDAAVRADIVRYAAALAARLDRYGERVETRLVPVLEDDLDAGAAQALETLLRDAGWRGDIGRNPCACARGDRQRVGAFHERHPHSLEATRQAAARRREPDSLSNDGWAFATDLGDGRLDPSAVPELVRVTQAASVWYHLWYDPLQGYPVPGNGPRNLRFDHPPATVLSWLAAGVQ